MSWLHRFSLRTIIFGSFTLVLLITMLPTLLLISREVDMSLRDSLDMRGSYLARSLAERGALPFQNEQMRKEVLESVQIAQGEGGAFLVDAQLKYLGSSFAGLEVGPVIAKLGEVDRTKLAQGAGPLSAGPGLIFWAHPAKERRPDVIEGNAAGSERIVGYAVVVLSDKQVVEAKSSVQEVLLLAFISGMVAFLVLLFFISRTFIIQPLAGMMIAAKKISDCDLTEKLPVHGSDELGQLGGALNRTSENLRLTLGKVKGVSEGIATVIDQISHTADVVARGAATTAQSVDETSSSMEEMIASLKGIAENVEVLAQSAEESSSSILQMAATNDEVAENIAQLAASVEETTAAIEQMTFSIKQVAKNVEDLAATAEETSSSMNEMNVSIGQVEMNANETAKLSELVSQDAETGMKSLQKTLGGIDKIKESSKEAAHVIESLGKKIETIGNILNVIDDVAEQTNLLALNAAIIAAQAGEHGKGFAVVADEIKDLAERTGASTKEISHLIQSIQEESRNAIGAMERGVRNVEEGVRLGGEAESALKKINESASKATQMVKAIARATVEQARGSKQVTNAISRIAQTVQQTATATAEQAKGSEQIMKSAERMRAITKHVERSSQEQARGSKQITRSIENINEMVSHLNRAQKEQTKGSEQVMNAVESIKNVADQQNRSMQELERAIDALAKQGDVLRDEVRRFRV
ncbi:MAG: methyl-accepting chemotaxis protein [Myxococcales bacterium]|jgi:methyl-accepting chemotaxis protein